MVLNRGPEATLAPGAPHDERQCAPIPALADMVKGAAFPSRDALTIGFAHLAYRAAEEFARRRTGVAHFEVRTLEELERRAHEPDVLVVSGLWRNTFLASAPKLRFVQSFSAGTDQYDKAQFVKHGVRLANAQGANERAVAEHGLALILALTRQLHLAHENQRMRRWRGMIGDRALREQELGGKTLVIVGLGRIGMRLAALARAFDMRVIGVRRAARPEPGLADLVIAHADLAEALAQADVVALTCPLTAETEGLIGAAAMAALKPGALLINVARGKVVDEAALIAALADGAGARGWSRLLSRGAAAAQIRLLGASERADYAPYGGRNRALRGERR